MPAKASVGSDVSSPRGSGRRARARHQRVDLLLDEAVDRRGGAGDERDADRARTARRARGRQPGVARNMPMTAQKTISDTTRGLVSARKCLSRVSASASVVKRVRRMRVGGSIGRVRPRGHCDASPHQFDEARFTIGRGPPVSRSATP